MSKKISRPAVRQRIKEQVVRMIADEALLAGDKIVSQNELAARFSTTPVTIHKALTELSREGVVTRRKGVGTFVADRKSNGAALGKKVCLVLHRSGLDRPDLNPEYWPYLQDLIFEFMKVLDNRYSFSLKFAGEETNISQFVKELKGYEAVFFHYSNEVPFAIMQAVARSRVAPVVKIGKMQKDLLCLMLDNDRFEGFRMGTARLVELGNKDIAFVGSSEWWGDIAVAGYRFALSDAGLTEPAGGVIRVVPERQGGVEAADKLLKLGKLPEAVMVDSDLRAIGLIEELKKKGVNIPADVSVMSYDGLQMFTYHPPYLSAVKVPYGEMISAAMEEIAKHNGASLGKKVLSFAGSILEGKTTIDRKSATKEKSTSQPQIKR
jgi:DNA-binding LacI/PurR family transcriptional regulator/DNA-binding transcriptional regulator YhcF (GntR family)